MNEHDIASCGGCIGGPHIRGEDDACPECVWFVAEVDMKRVWYWPPWDLTSSWKVYVATGADEFERKTLMFHLGPLGCVVVATSKPGSAPVGDA